MHIQIPVKHLRLSVLQKHFTAISVGIYMLKLNNGNKNNLPNVFNPLSADPTKMVKHTQTIGKLSTNCLSVFDSFVGLMLKGLKLVV